MLMDSEIDDEFSEGIERMAVIAHLDSDEKMDYPKLEQARKSVVFYHSYLVTHEAQAGVLDGLIDSTEQFSLYFSSCKVHAEKTYRILTQTSQK